MEHPDPYPEEWSPLRLFLNPQIIDLSSPLVMAIVVFQLLVSLFTILIKEQSSATPTEDSLVPMLPLLTLPGVMSFTVTQDKKLGSPISSAPVSGGTGSGSTSSQAPSSILPQIIG